MKYVINQFVGLALIPFCSSPCSLAAVALFVILMLSVGVVLFGLNLILLQPIINYQMASTPEHTPNYVAQGLITGFQISGIVSMSLMMFRLDKRPAHDCIADADHQPWHLFIGRNIRLFGIVPFFYAILVFDVFLLIASWNCYDAWIACSSGVVRAENIVDLARPVIRTVYLFTEVTICVNFNATDFHRNKLLLAGLAIVQAANLSCWLDALLIESSMFSSDRFIPTYREISQCFNETGINVSEHYVHCVSRTTGEYKLLESASPYLFPFTVEFLLLVTECLLDLFFREAGGVESTKSTLQTTTDRSVTGSETTTSRGRTNIEKQLQLGTVASSSDFVQFIITNNCQENSQQTQDVRTDDNADMGCNLATSCSRCPSLFIAYVMLTFPSIFFIIFAIYNLSIGEVTYRDMFIDYRILYWLMLSLAALVGYRASRCFPSGPRNLNSFEYLAMFSCTGSIVQSVLAIVDDVHTLGFLAPLTMSFIESICSIMQICIQLAFYLHAKSVKTDGNEANSRHRSLILTGVVWFFAVSNFALWLENSFIVAGSSSTSWQKQYFDNSPLIYNIFSPLALLFRFNSALLFLNVLFDRRPVQ